MKTNILLLFVMLTFVVFSCKKDKEVVVPNPPTETKGEQLEKVLIPLTKTPLEWTDSELSFLDKYKDKPFIGLGEASHGSGNIFESKFRIFRYMVEKHGFKNFIFEADFTESIFLDQAIQESRTEDIRAIMVNKMHFWTWSTTEVLQLLEWMSEYNRDKPEGEKLHYFGNDCQFDTYQNYFLFNFLQTTQAPFRVKAKNILKKVRIAINNDFENYNHEDYDALIELLQSITDSMEQHRDELIALSNETEFYLQERLLVNIEQVCQVIYEYEEGNYTARDKGMADNTVWFGSFYGGKSVVWAHNYHIKKAEETMGGHINTAIGEDYINIGYAFAKGHFTAIAYDGESYTGLAIHEITEDPKNNSINRFFYETKEDAFCVNMAELASYSKWTDSLSEGIEILGIGSVFDGNPSNYYNYLFGSDYDEMIYLKLSTASNHIYE